MIYSDNLIYSSFKGFFYSQIINNSKDNPI